MQTKYATYRVEDCQLRPNCLKPNVWDYFSEIDYPDYEIAIAAYNESLKISYPIVGDVSKVKGRKDLVENTNFYFSYPKTGNQIVAVLIDNQQKDEQPAENILSQFEENNYGKLSVPNADAYKKANDLFDRYKSMHLEAGGIGITDNQAKQCALIAVEELIEWDKDSLYWKQVKQSISKL